MAQIAPSRTKRLLTLKKSASMKRHSTRFLANKNGALDPLKFEEVMSHDLTSSFDESSTCFETIGQKAASIMDAQQCCIYIVDENDHHVSTYVKDSHGNDIEILKPLDRGITGFVLTEGEGLNLNDATQSKQWSMEIDHVRHPDTKSYLGWPLVYTMDGSAVGVLEFHNSNTGSFDVADEQIAQILAFQISRAIVHYRQQTLLDVRNKAIDIAYRGSADTADSIAIDQERMKAPIFNAKKKWSVVRQKVLVQKRRAMLVPSSSWKSFPSNRRSILTERDWGYDVFSKSREELVRHTVEIFQERGLLSCFSIPVSIFTNFVNEIAEGYNSNAPYHNHYHAFDVMHVCYMLISRCNADNFLDSFDVLAILVGALAHDLGHDGFNNTFHCSTNSELAVVYNGISVLENYSAAYLFRILRKENCNIFARLSESEVAKMRSRLIGIILDTDAKNHFLLMNRFKHSLDVKQLPRSLLSSMLLHVSDVSNPTRPGVIARKWAYAVQEEFFRQGDKEKELNLPISPFMDRNFENLPRMQSTFIDALVNPVFKVLAELLPSINRQCLRQLQINRSFWNSMQNQSIITSEDIVNHLKRHCSKTADEDLDLNNVDDIVDDYEQAISPPDTPIPGIPADARKEGGKKSMKMISLIQHREESMVENLDDLELGINPVDEIGVLTEKQFRRTSVIQRIRKRIKGWLTSILNSSVTKIFLMIATVYSLIATDLNLVVGSKETDPAINGILFAVFLIFLIELVLAIACDPKYTRFFFWLDITAAVSLLLEMDFLFDGGNSSSGGLEIAKAGRAAKVGARAGRLAKIFSVVRLFKVAKVLKIFMANKKRHEQEIVDAGVDTDGDIDVKMSIVGRKMIDSITKKVVLAVLFMLTVFSLLQVESVPDGRQLQLDALAIDPNSQVLKDGFFRAHPNLLRLVGIEPFFEMTGKIKTLRNVEILTLQSASDEEVQASFDLSSDVSTAALLSLATTFIATALLLVLSLLLSSDAYKIMIAPIENMKNIIQRLSENPLQHLVREKNVRKSKVEGTQQVNETDLLEEAINKMAALLQVGFGSAGAEIIGKNMGAKGELDPMIPGRKIHAIFGFCNINDFIRATEFLQQDIMLFVNEIASITHRYVVSSGGAPNKNSGDSFFLVWKFETTEDGEVLGLQKERYDAALKSAQSIIAEVAKLGNILNFVKWKSTDGEEQKRERKSVHCDNKIAMSFGLHTGWAIEGPIGSMIKVDASYLSPHVTLVAQIEGATAHYKVPLLMSESFMAGLSGNLQSVIRKVDRLIFKGHNEPMVIFHHDIKPFITLREKPENYDDLILATAWKDQDELTKIGIDLTKTLKILQAREHFRIREIYDTAFHSYLEGAWGKCKVLLHLWLEKFPADTLAQSLVMFLMKYNFKCPEDWKGHHHCSESV